MKPEADTVAEFLLRRRDDALKNADKSQETIEEWLSTIDRLYSKITGDLLADATTRGLVQVAPPREKQIREEFLGTYRAPELVLDLGGEIVRFSPIARIVLGSKGRVDLVGEADTMALIVESDDRWNIVLSRVPRRVEPLSEKTLTEALRAVMRPR